MVYPVGGKLTCKRCGWSDSKAAESKIVDVNKASGQAVVVHEEKQEARPIQDAECPKCGHEKAYFHLMQTRRSDEPPTEINECVKCGHSWREY